MLRGALRRARKCTCGGHLGLQGLRGVMGMGCMGAWLACAARAGVLLAMLGTHGGGRLCCDAWARWTSGRQGGSSRRVVVAAPTLAAAANPPSTCRTSSRSKKCEYRLEVQVDKVRDLCAKDVPSGPRESGQCSSTRLFWSCSSYMVHHGASTRRARPLDAPPKIPVPSHVPGDTSGHGRWTATTRKRQCDGIGTVRWEGAMQTPSRSRTPGARKTTSKTCRQASRSCQKA